MMVSRSNEDWLRNLRGGSDAREKAVAELRDYLMRAALVYLSRHRSDVAGWTAERLRQFAEDAAQEAILEIEDNLDNFRGDSKFTTWAYRFVINRAAGELRRSRYSDRSFEEIQEDETTFFEGVLAEYSEALPETRSAQREMANILLEIIENELTIRQREAMVKVYFQGQSMEKVAKQLDTSRNTLYKLLYDARQKIHAALAKRHLSKGDILAPFED